MSQIICRSEPVCVAVFFVPVRLTIYTISATSIHWHGQNQNGTNFMDGECFNLGRRISFVAPDIAILIGTSGITECGIVPGSTFTYNWTVQNVGTL
jgi:FtsP/CotA-like multicopper oxidase with cupredoxin domain